MFDIITFGSGVIDIFVDTHLREQKHKLIYPVGSKILIKNLRYDVGGGGTNTAVSFSRLGFKTGWIGKVGNDSQGKQVLDCIKKEKVSFLGKTSHLKTGCSIILDSMEHERTILTYKGENDNISFEEISQKNAKWYYFSSMVGESFKTQKKLARYVKSQGINLCFNPSEYQLKDPSVKDIIKNTDILIFNKEEAELLTGKKDLNDMFMAIHKLGPVISCITDGKNGNYCSDMEKIYRLEASKTKPIERTGAGDAFASGFLAALIKTGNIELAMQIGSTNAESVIKYFGAKNKLLTWSEATNNVTKHPFRITERLL